MTMIASVLRLDRKALHALRVTDLYSLHRVVYSLYEDVRTEIAKADGETSGILFADQGGDFFGRKILLLANRMPATCLEGQYGEVLSKQINDSFLEYERYRFKVIVNPSYRDAASHKRVPVKGREAIGDWFLKKSEQSWGFRASSEHLQVDRVDVQKFKAKQQCSITIAQAQVQGQLCVTNREKFRNSFCRGIGSGRAFGCGLLQMVPLLDNSLA
ncbi:MAG: type I-E CRISPR-associated protein Cas6/Cse3/CasE [Pseudomonadales bacterium]|nr:type I-E CRISPR-associated protein Cas6/Cse3/CasE [Pseudomonadales bacterium]